MKKFTIQAVLLLLVIGTAIFLVKTKPQISNLPFLPEAPVFRQLQINDAKFKVELADTQTKRSKGLGDRQTLASDEGMLFIFPKPEQHQFWMKGLSFPLDFIWIRDNEVVGILPNVPSPEPGQPDSSLPIYQSGVAVDKVLEVPAGTIQRLNIKIGDTVKVE